MNILNGSSGVIARRVAIVTIVGLLAGLLSGAGLVSAALRGSAAPQQTRELDFSPTPAEFSRVPASYHPPSYSPEDYRLCLNWVRKNELQHGEFPAGTPLSAYVSGVSDAAKQGTGVVTGLPTPSVPTPALLIATGRYQGYTAGNTPQPLPDGHYFSCAYAVAHLDYEGLAQLPPMRTTFLGFGFQPVSATVTLEQVGPHPVVTLVAYADQGTPGPGAVPNQTTPFISVATAHLRLVVSDVAVNGVPLDVGPSCRTKGTLTTPGNGIDPGALVLVGGDAPDDPEPDANNPAAGGALAGLASIPPFTGCVSSSGENLDALLTASVSGPRNYVQVDEGTPCSGFGYGTCTSSKLPLYGPNYSVTHGGNYTASSPPATGQGAFEIQSGILVGFTMTCNSSTISGSFPDASPPVRGAFATVRFSNFSGCVDNSGNKYSITSHVTSYFSGLLNYNTQTNKLDPNAIYGNLDHLALTITGPHGCEEVLSGSIQAQYDNIGANFTVNPVVNFSQPMSLVPGKPQCASIMPTTSANNYPGYGMTGTYQLGPAKPVITNGLP
jgi:hypothetical protein